MFGFELVSDCALLKMDGELAWGGEDGTTLYEGIK